MSIHQFLPENSNPSGHVPVSRSHLQALPFPVKSKIDPGARIHFLPSPPHVQVQASMLVPPRGVESQNNDMQKITVKLAQMNLIVEIDLKNNNFKTFHLYLRLIKFYTKM
jgi:hypothetical protein